MPFINISNGTIEEISSERDTTFVTVSYRNRQNNRRDEQRVRLVVSPGTIILNTNGAPLAASSLRTGMTVNAVFSAAMTRSIPPQATAYVIELVRRPRQENTMTGRILDINRENRSFTTISDQNVSSITRFNVPENTMIFDRAGRSVNFSRLTPGMQVRVRHANFMTASIPPQTTAIEIRIL